MNEIQDKKCIICGSDFFEKETTVGIPLQGFDMCTFCWDDLPKYKKIEYLNKGYTSIQRQIIHKDIKDWLREFDKFVEKSREN